MTKPTKTERDDAIAKLRDWLNPGDKVYTILDSVSRSGMSRQIRVVLLRYDEDKKQTYALHPNWAVATALGYRQAKRGDGIMVGGCGMDMGFHLVYRLGEVLWPNGTPTPHGTRNGEPDSVGGYALKQEWL